ncbi:MAG: UvrD-helicase domain-containing protein [Bryobacterales bacterium]|nr:UvrD-helicase domain-containing protein [Bryobacterales bacterium]
MSLLASLNPQQREAVEHTEGPLLVLAGAGSGKTRVIVTRAAYLIAEKGVRPSSILAVTFTNKAAGEMRERVGRLLEENGMADRGPAAVSTFHAFCARLLRQHGDPLADHRPGFTSNFLICDADDQLSVVKDVMKKLGVKPDFIRPREALSAISRAKNGRLSRIGKASENDPTTDELNRIFKEYEAALLASNALDFDDLLLEAVRLLEGSESVRSAIRERYHYLMVDEYQDTNRPQYDLMLLLAGPNCNVCVVGDEDQSIYSWRGADIGNILGFERDFPSARVIRLEQNYRSTRPILEAAGAVVAHNKQRKGKHLWTDRLEGDPILLYRAASAAAEARYVAGSVRELLDADPRMQVGVLYRTNAQSRLIEDALRRESVGYVLVGSVAFYQRKEVKDVLAYVRVAFSPEDSVSLARIINTPARGIGKSTLGLLTNHADERSLTLWQAIEETLEGDRLPKRAAAALKRFQALVVNLRGGAASMDIAALVDAVLDRSGYRDMLDADSSAEAETRKENVGELVVAAQEAAERGETAQDFLDHASLVADTDDIDSSARVLLMTLHSSKGLEFPAVFLVGMEEQLLPHARSLGTTDNDALEEERRLCYVGMTRAQRRLVLSCAEYRGRYGAGPEAFMRPSRFLSEIPSELIRDVSPGWIGLDRSRVYQSTDDAIEPQPVPNSRSDRSKLEDAGIETHDSVEAIGSFFKSRAATSYVAGTSGGPGSGSSSRTVPAPSGGFARGRGRAAESAPAAGQFARGAKVRHRRFGVGVVQQCQGQGERAKLSVYFRHHGLKTLIAGPAKLQAL